MALKNFKSSSINNNNKSMSEFLKGPQIKECSNTRNKRKKRKCQEKLPDFSCLKKLIYEQKRKENLGNLFSFNDPSIKERIDKFNKIIEKNRQEDSNLGYNEDDEIAGNFCETSKFGYTFINKIKNNQNKGDDIEDLIQHDEEEEIDEDLDINETDTRNKDLSTYNNHDDNNNNNNNNNNIENYNDNINDANNNMNMKNNNNNNIFNNIFNNIHSNIHNNNHNNNHNNKIVNNSDIKNKDILLDNLKLRFDEFKIDTLTIPQKPINIIDENGKEKKKLFIFNINNNTTKGKNEKKRIEIIYDDKENDTEESSMEHQTNYLYVDKEEENIKDDNKYDKRDNKKGYLQDESKNNKINDSSIIGSISHTNNNYIYSSNKKNSSIYECNKLSNDISNNNFNYLSNERIRKTTYEKIYPYTNEKENIIQHVNKYCIGNVYHSNNKMRVERKENILELVNKIKDQKESYLYFAVKDNTLLLNENNDYFSIMMHYLCERTNDWNIQMLYYLIMKPANMDLLLYLILTYYKFPFLDIIEQYQNISINNIIQSTYEEISLYDYYYYVFHILEISHEQYYMSLELFNGMKFLLDKYNFFLSRMHKNSIFSKNKFVLGLGDIQNVKHIFLNDSICNSIYQKKQKLESKDYIDNEDIVDGEESTTDDPGERIQEKRRTKKKKKKRK
ncbi:hypothetical protein PFUGPA_03800 [Plasmodium falciparum Palo Alto/Uganda]|uniref:Uncharacterized protein n=1 Tax=Plasmodium falciparum (isolate Palo Alto / Uganda) TaxID=57270 RepID=W4IX39_PLAFP|nr:hypothetical protein PFUGPA_03800 [Plasmodium falciparum Palo Alto/Uganda]